MLRRTDGKEWLIVMINQQSGSRHNETHPALSWLAPTPVEALAGLADVVRGVLADLAASGEPVPEPLSERAYSGRFVIRVPAEVHRRLALEAAEQHVSLNRLVSDQLASA